MDAYSSSFILKSLLAGGVAGMCAKTTVAPLDRIKILLQAHNKHYKHHGVFSGLRNIVAQENFLALYKGNGAQMVRIFPYASTQFTSFEVYKKLLNNVWGDRRYLSKLTSAVAGSLAGVTAVFLTYPLDTIRARLAFQVSGEHRYTGIVNAAVTIFQTEGGARALYRGFTATVCGMIPYAGLSFYCFEQMKYFCMKYLPEYTCSTCEKNTGGLVLSIPAKLLSGGLAGAVAQSFSYPFDVTRRRMQLAWMTEETRKFGDMGMAATLRLIYRENGVTRGLYRGMSINYMRAIPMVAVSFSTYEITKQVLGLDTGLRIKTG
ncbi:graves disease carrier protein-like isoform X1 [Penaeus chinensis]|uniref:graves disease carrier protein-like isoform X1 n=1 Tax=Penaeus chinensis TaxID=139456 RepID=UPI001FB7DAEE|nr:graves disease carrier protein-like isoform X1 [Penaeus chinensis]